MTTPSPTQDEFVETRSVSLPRLRLSPCRGEGESRLVLIELSLTSAQVTLEWKVSGLKTLFEQSKGDVKSKCIKSAPFDSNRWQGQSASRSPGTTGLLTVSPHPVFFYPNSGHVGLSPSCVMG